VQGMSFYCFSRLDDRIVRQLFRMQMKRVRDTIALSAEELLVRTMIMKTICHEVTPVLATQ
jgi:hypothetical protein